MVPPLELYSECVQWSWTGNYARISPHFFFSPKCSLYINAWKARTESKLSLPQQYIPSIWGGGGCCIPANFYYACNLLFCRGKGIMMMIMSDSISNRALCSALSAFFTQEEDEFLCNACNNSNHAEWGLWWWWFYLLIVSIFCSIYCTFLWTWKIRSTQRKTSATSLNLRAISSLITGVKLVKRNAGDDISSSPIDA